MPRSRERRAAGEPRRALRRARRCVISRPGPLPPLADEDFTRAFEAQFSESLRPAGEHAAAGREKGGTPERHGWLSPEPLRIAAQLIVAVSSWSLRTGVTTR